MKLPENKFVRFALFMVFFLAFWNLVMLINHVLIFHDEYHFALLTGLGLPLICGAVSGYILIWKTGSR